MARILVDDRAVFALLKKLADIKADRIHFAIGSHRFAYLKDAHDIGRMLVAPLDRVDSSHLQAGSSGIRKDERVITNTAGDEWAAQRKNLTGFMGKTGLKAGFAAEAEGDVAAYLSTWAKRDSIAVAEEASVLALKYAFRSLFNHKADPENCRAIHQGIETLHNYLAYSALTFGRMPKSWLKTISRVHVSTGNADRMSAILMDEYDQADPAVRERHLYSRIFGDIPGGYAGAGLGQVRARSNEIFIGSHLPVRNAFYWAMHHLAREPELQERIRHDHEKGVSMRPDAGGNMATVSKVVMEVLRLHPSAEAFTKDVLQDMEDAASGLSLKAGTTVIYSTQSVHQNPKYYEDPERFAPDTHFSADALRARPRTAYLPFGAGPHTCPGNGAAMQQFAATLSHMMAHYRLEALPGEDALPPERADILPRPDNRTRLKVIPR